MTRNKYDANLPKNLTYRKNDKAFYWRNPLTKKEISLGQISRREAVAQAIEANNYLAQNFSPVSLIEKLKGMDSLTVAKWLERYDTLLQRRDLAANTYKIRGNQLAMIKEKIGGMILREVSTRHVAEFLDPWISEGKNTMAAGMRSVLSDLFREAIVEGHIEQNPVTPTRTPTIKVERDRLDLDVFNQIRIAAEQLPVWFPLAMDLALVTAQRREDVATMRFSDIYDDRLHVIQKKTGAMLAIPLSLTLPATGLRLSTVVDRCRLVSRSDYLISAGIRKNSPDGSIHPDGLTKKFVAARNLSGVELSSNPPTFHEIRSLSGRLYEVSYGKEFAQKLFGHKSEKMTEKYLDKRQNEYVMI
ncbi:phage integrase Arm DNA-binding domain-containing protein [Scandinavium goeteborgense]|uniref:tyrosine-type recombinase/integrase n=1 Tax=Scandinavium goeteborgense TaxID=1851514 RepID=UPI0021669B80|nr:tyrosine-type recombinase/integrase [Scandinavium goeteborgense]MCS2154750.1 phage integrase Arm DNA-binding domain-containing protein [Scandinavium goeteborgense]